MPQKSIDTTKTKIDDELHKEMESINTKSIVETTIIAYASI